jgi:hypothetical protein
MFFVLPVITGCCRELKAAANGKQHWAPRRSIIRQRVFFPAGARYFQL